MTDTDTFTYNNSLYTQRRFIKKKKKKKKEEK